MGAACVRMAAILIHASTIPAVAHSAAAMPGPYDELCMLGSPVTMFVVLSLVFGLVLFWPFCELIRMWRAREN